MLGMMQSAREAQDDLLFAVEYDPGSAVVRAMLSGFWTVEIAKDYVREYDAAVSECRRSAGRLKLLSDARDMPIQARDVVDIISKADSLRAGDRVALIVSTMLARLSSRRSMAAGYPKGVEYEIFVSVAEAEAWLHQHKH